MSRITKVVILEAFKVLPESAETTTRRIAKRLNCSEFQVRAGISSLVVGGQLVEAGETIRKDTRGGKYTAKPKRNNRIFISSVVM